MDILNLEKSRTRKKILQLFFLSPDKRYYLRELERVLEISVGNIRRELLSLEKVGLFKKEKDGKQVYFSLNKESIIFNEFKKIISKTIGVEFQIAKDLKKIKNITVAFIFGSFATGDEDSLSDVDLMVIGNPDEDSFVKVICGLEKEIGREINYHIFTESDWKKKIKDKNSFIQNITAKPKLFLIGNQNELSKIC